ncbi:MAG: hypothetical protein NW207_09875 [Cytophagales bacterium]|nr:hypothetical protein [Cytophagales bacterium]
MNQTIHVGCLGSIILWSKKSIFIFARKLLILHYKCIYHAPKHTFRDLYITGKRIWTSSCTKKVTALLEFSFSQAEKKVEQIATQKKLEIKDEMSKELATKGDIAVLESKIMLEIERLESKINTSKSESRLYFIILLCTIIILNRDSLTFIAQILGVVK